MIVDLDNWRRGQAPAEAPGASVNSVFARMGAGSGSFAFDSVSVGVVLRPLASHRARYASDRQRAFPLAAGEGWVFPAGMEGHCAWDSDHEFLNVSLSSTHFDAAGVGIGQIGRAQAGALDPLTVTLALQIHSAGPDTSATSLYRSTLASALAAHLARSFAASEAPLAPSALDDARLKRVEDAIEAELGRAWTLEDLARIAAMSAFHFARSFKSRTGLAPHQYLVSRRIERAKVLLRTTALPVAEIGIRLGWENASKFGAQFKKHTGGTPGAWRSGN